MYKFYIYHPSLKQAKLLKYDPIGWDSFGKTTVRDLGKHGIFFEYTPKLQFVKDGKDLMKHFFRLEGIEHKVEVIVYKRNSISREYEFEYRGRPNFVKPRITKNYFECIIEQTGFVQKIKNLQEVKVDLKSPLTISGKPITAYDPETVNVSLHSKIILKQFSTTPGETSSLEGGITLNATRYIHYSFEPLEFSEISRFYDYATQASSENSLSIKKYSWLLEEAGEYTFNINLHNRVFSFRIIPGDGIVENDYEDYEWFFVYGKPGDYTEISLGSVSKDGDEDLEGLEVEPTHVATYNFSAGTEVYIYGKVKITSGGDGFVPFHMNKLENFSIQVNAKTFTPASTAPLFLIHEAIARVIESITDEPDSFRSNYFGRVDSQPTAYPVDGEGSLRGYVSGSLVRGFPIDTNTTHLSLKHILESCLAIDGAGFGIITEGIKQRAVIEPISFFYSNKRSAQFKYVSALEITVADDLIWNTMDAGYDIWENEEINNLDEFNTNGEFVSPITQLKNPLVLRSPIIGSGYTLEFVRRDRYSDASTKDNPRDLNVFIIQLRRNDGTLVTDKDEDFAELNNLLSPETVYNAKLSVMRNIKRNGPYILSGLYHHEDKFIKRQVGKGNTQFNSRLTTEAEVVDESSIQISKLGKALWIPEIHSFQFKPTAAQLAAINADPYGYIEFCEDDTEWYAGYIIKCQPKDKDGLFTYNLLRKA